MRKERLELLQGGAVVAEEVGAGDVWEGKGGAWEEGHFEVGCDGSWAGWGEISACLSIRNASVGPSGHCDEPSQR